MISKITLNRSFASMELKKNDENFLPPEYFIERLRSFGDKQMAQMAQHLQKIHTQFSTIKQACPVKQQSFCMQNQQIMLDKFLKSRQHKKFFLYFSQITPKKITLKNVIFSNPLLQALGCNIKNIGVDFIRFKHVFFDVYTAKNYGNVMERCFDKFSQLQAELMVNPELSMEQRIKLTEFEYDDDVVRRTEVDGVYNEEVLRAKCLWSSPHPSVCYFEVVDINESEMPRLGKNVKPKEIEVSKREQQFQFLRKLGLDYMMLQTSNQSNTQIENINLEIPEVRIPNYQIKVDNFSGLKGVQQN